MQKISSVAGLKNAIRVLEAEQAVALQSLNEHFFQTIQAMRPANLLIGTLKNMANSPTVFDQILGTAVGLATGYLTKKIFIGTSGNLIRRLTGSILQFGITKVIAKHPEVVKSFGEFIFRLFPVKTLRIQKSRDR